MKRIPAILMVLILTVTAGAALAENDPAERLAAEWENALALADRLYGHMFWALDAVDEWTETASWESLAKARAACLLASLYLSEFGIPELTLTDEELYALAADGVAIDVLPDYSRPETNSREMHDYFRIHLFLRMCEEAEWADERESLREFSAALRGNLEIECAYLALATNYLYASLPASGGAERWPALQAAFPTVIGTETAWNDDPLRMEERAMELVLASDDALAALVGAMQRANARSENLLIDLEEGRQPERLEIAGLPAVLPSPMWFDPEVARFACFRWIDGILESPECGSTLTMEDCNILFRQENVSLEEAEEYVDSIGHWVSTVKREGDEWTILMDGYSVLLSWASDTVQMIFLGDSFTFMYR